MLSESERGTIEKRLQEERERAVEALQRFDRSRQESMQEETGDLTSYPFHPADLGTEAMEQEKQFLLASTEGQRLWEIDEALRRLYRDPDGFGTCQRDGETIGMDRLEMVPWTTLCAEHARELES